MEANQHRLKIAIAIDRDTQHLALHPPVEALNHAVDLWRVGTDCPMYYAVPLTGALEAIGREAGTAVCQHMRDAERQGGHSSVEEGHGQGSGLVVVDR